MDQSGELRRVLGLGFGIAVTVGSAIGAGILRAPSLIAQLVPDAGVMLLLWIAGGAVAAMGANVLSELATAMPRAGGPYIYVRRALGDVAGLAVGWTTWMSSISAIAALCVASADFAGLIWPGARTPVTAIALEAALIGYNMTGLRQGSVLQQIVTLAKVMVLAGLCWLALTAAPSLTQTESPPALLGWAGLIAAFQLVSSAYSGWQRPAFFAEENRNAATTVPRAMGIGILITGVLYVTVSSALDYSMGPSGMANNVLAFSTVLSRSVGPASTTVFALVAMLFAASCANGAVMAAPRILLALSRDGMLPSTFQSFNKGGSPTSGMLLTFAGAAVLSLSGSFKLVFGMIATLNAATFALAIVALFVLRRREPDLERPFRALLYPWLPAAALIIELALFALFLTGSPQGAAYAAGFWLLCIPLAMFARRRACA
jgi:APA family basic amino acid/polyamine antiporter